MFDIAWSEMAVIAGVALLVIGPKDLPRVLRTMGQWTSKARGLAHEFQSAIEDLANEEELKDFKKQVESGLPELASDFSAESLANTIDPDGGLRKSLGDLSHPEAAGIANLGETWEDIEEWSESRVAEALAAELVQPPEAVAAPAPELEALAAELMDPPEPRTGPQTEPAAKAAGSSEPAHATSATEPTLEPAIEKNTGSGANG